MSGAGPRRVAEIDLSAITANVSALRAAAGTRHLMAVVKADGYGHGAAASAQAALAGGADWLGVADVDEALALRAAGIMAPVLAWLHDAEPDFRPAAAAGIDVGVSSVRHLRAAAVAGAVVQIKVDTGLSRNGVAPDAWESLFQTAAALERDGRIRVRGLFSHLANTSAASDAEARARFEAALRLARDTGLDPDLLHLASTAAALTRDQTGLTMVRTGIGIYGLSPFDDGDAGRLGLRPAMTVRTSVVAVRRIALGDGVSYDHTWRADRATTLALVPMGYADGVPRAASNRAEVMLGGLRRPVRGRIAMDQFLVDVGDSDVQPGDDVVLFGDGAAAEPTAADWAAWAGTIDYEIVTRLGARVGRVFGDR